MLKAPSEFIIVFIIVSVILILAMAVFIAVIIYRYQQKQNRYFKDIEALKTSYKNTLLQSQLEIQEQTFETISREIHDNIGHELSLAKLYLTTLDFKDKNKLMLLINDSADIIGKSISDLRDLSRSMSSEIILNYGLQKALEIETVQIAKSGIYKINLSVTGDRVCMNTETELVLFRIVQEVLNNIVKHSEASVIEIKLHFTASLLTVEVNDDGKGFNTAETLTGNGLHNIKKRADILNGNLTIKSNINQGTIIKIEIPLFEYNHET